MFSWEILHSSWVFSDCLYHGCEPFCLMSVSTGSSWSWCWLNYCIFHCILLGPGSSILPVSQSSSSLSSEPLLVTRLLRLSMCRRKTRPSGNSTKYERGPLFPMTTPCIHVDPVGKFLKYTSSLISNSRFLVPLFRSSICCLVWSVHR